MILIAVAVLALVMALALLHLFLELHQRDLHLAWIDERDKHFVTLFEHAWDLTLVPRGNPLDGFKAHGGMLAKDAFMRADTLIPMLDERLTVLTKGLDFTVKAAKDLRAWEMQHPAPPVHYWQVGGLVLRKRRKGRMSEQPPSEQVVPKGVLDGPIKALEKPGD